jgi:pimeloyl-ACP methyl ester carboxylesterase
MIAPLLAKDRDVAGVAVFGTSAQRWHECIVASTLRQCALAGYEGDLLDLEMARRTELGVRVYREGFTPAQVFEQCPHLAALRSRDCNGATLFGRHVALFQQLEAVDLGAAWQQVRAPVFVAHGEYDSICSAEEARAIGAFTGSSSHRLEMPRIGHDMLAHRSLERSFRSSAEGVWDGRVADTTLAWMRGLP